MSGGGKLLFSSQMIDRIQVGEKIDWFYRVLECTKKKKKDGGDFLTLLLMDKSGRIAGKVWENSEQYQRLIETGGIYRICGEVTEYNQKREIRITRVATLSGSENGFDPENYVETAPFDNDALMAEARELLRLQLLDPHLVRLVDELFLRHGDELKIHPGAQKIHHAYPGGLLEHTTSLLRLAVAVAEHFGLDKELLLVGALFHDIGKIREFQFQPAPETTLAGGLLGHVVISLQMFRELAGRVPAFPESLAQKIEHLIVAHHGEKEYGAPELPKIPEAYALHLLDLLDSRLNIFREVAGKAEGKGLFSDYQNALGTRILLNRE